ncbi:MAG TPA: TIGR02206 family membrane protein [Solirubrobacteraceae bacterium]|nr:TIGR02206 family membrane protein [Solirubrobacteraceae bacterium]
MRQFSVAHDAALAVLVVGGAVAIVGPRRWPGRWVRWFAWALAAVIFAGWAGEYLADVIEGIWTVQYSLPLQLTDAVSVVAIIALLTQAQLAIELVYFWAFSASLQAVLTPDLASTFPNVFYFTYFCYHVGSIVAACLLVFGCRRYPRRGAMWWVFGLTLVWAGVAGLGDVVTGGNYMYLASKPVHNSLLNVMGPWPWYIAASAVVGLVMFFVLDRIAVAVARRDGVRVVAR